MEHRIFRQIPALIDNLPAISLPDQTLLDDRLYLLPDRIVPQFAPLLMQICSSFIAMMGRKLYK
jgi:hypothetical protein